MGLRFSLERTSDESSSEVVKSTSSLQTQRTRNEHFALIGLQAKASVDLYLRMRT